MWLLAGLQECHNTSFLVTAFGTSPEQPRYMAPGDLPRGPESRAGVPPGLEAGDTPYSLGWVEGQRLATDKGFGVLYGPRNSGVQKRLVTQIP